MTASSSAPAATTETDSMPAFVTQSARGGLVCDAVGMPLAGGSADTLGQRVADFFADNKHAPDLLVGALPFDRNAPDHLFQPGNARWLPAATNTPRAPQSTDTPWRLRNGTTSAEFAATVAQALQQLDDATLRKVVLARLIELETDRPVAIDNLVQRLAATAHATAFAVQLPPPSDSGQPRHLAGASPELLIAKTGRQVLSYPLAGTTKRREDHSEDQAAAQTLLHSDKDQREHQAVVEAVLDTLAPYCTDLPARPDTILRKTANLWHLGTPITATLADTDTSSAELAAALHPTPAVCGLPRAAADDAIGRLESFDRGFYAGAFGWTQANGDGEWHVAIRCAEIEGTQARLYAGAGIVPGSDPQQEARETAAKFAVMLTALGVDEQKLDHILESVA